MAAQINVCTPFSHCEKTKPTVQVFFVVLFFFAVCTCVCMCAYLATAAVDQLPGLIIIQLWWGWKGQQPEMSGCVQQKPDAAVRCSSVQLKKAE